MAKKISVASAVFPRVMNELLRVGYILPNGNRIYPDDPGHVTDLPALVSQVAAFRESRFSAWRECQLSGSEDIGSPCGIVLELIYHVQ